MSRQLPLPFPSRRDSTFDRFEVGGNGELLARLRRSPEVFECLWLYGERGVGKTHLLRAFCQVPASERCPSAPSRAPLYLEAKAGDGVREVLASLAVNEVAIDGVDRWLGERDAEIALVALHKRLAEGGGRLVLAADRSPFEADFALPDLATRMRTAACYRLKPLDDDDKSRLLVDAAADRGLVLSEDVVGFLLLRVSRDARELLRILDRLDRSALAAQRRLTIPFVKQVLCL